MANGIALRSLLILWLVAVFSALPHRPASAAAPIQALSLDEIRPGMVGEGRTVFTGQEVESFKVTILGVLRNFGPNQNMILAELEGGPLSHTGVIAGMSGSPVYIDGKLVGAVAYAFPFAKDPIAGITPIQEMLDATATPTTRRPAAALTFPLEPEQLAAAFPNRGSTVPIQASSGLDVDSVRPYLGQKLEPIATPASIVGFSPESFELVAPLFRQLGVEPLMGGAVSVASTGSVSASNSRTAVTALGQSNGQPHSSATPTSAASSLSLQPGGTIGVGLVTGDLQIAATGTVTHVDPESGEVYAFGHPLFNLGPIEYPMMTSDVHLVLPSVMNSFKMASSGDTIGTWLQDRLTAIKGLRDVRPRMIPLSVDVTTSRGQQKSYKMEVVGDELFSPVLTYASLIAVLQATERQFGNQTVKLNAWLETSGDHRVNIEDIFTDQQAAIAASAMVATPLALLLANDFEDLHVQSIRVEVEASETPATARLLRAWLDRDEVEPGGEAQLKLLLQSYRGDQMLESVDVRVPENVRTGSVRVLVADATTVATLERIQARTPFVPRDLDHLVRAMNSLRKNNRLYVRLSRADGAGGIVAGEYLTSLPPSVIQVLGADDSGGGFTRVGSSTFWEHEVVTDFHVSGSRTLELKVKAR